MQEHYEDLNEELEELVELSRQTLANYINAATLDVHNKAYRAGKYEGAQKRYDSKNIMNSLRRQSGISKATKKLTKEEIIAEARGRPRKDVSDEDSASEANLNIMNQIRKAADSGLVPFHVTFENGEKKPLPRSQAKKVLSKFMSLKPSERVAMQNHIAKSHSNLMSHL